VTVPQAPGQDTPGSARHGHPKLGLWPLAVCSPRNSSARQGATCGRAYPGIEVRAIDPLTGDVVPPGTPGEAAIRGLVMRAMGRSRRRQRRRSMPTAGFLPVI
jgi:hypothetical protein